MTTCATHRRVAQSILLACLLVATALAGAPAQAREAVPVEEQYVVHSVGTGQNPNKDLVFAASIRVQHPDGSKPEPDTVLNLEVSSCGRLLQSGSRTLQEEGHDGVLVWLSSDGESDASPNAVNRMVGPSIEYVLTVTQPHHEPYTRSGSYSGYGVQRPSCAQLNEKLQSCETTKWGHPRSGKRFSTVPRVGSLVAVTKTWTLCELRYEWLAHGDVVSQKRRLRIFRELRGKQLEMRIIAGPAPEADTPEAHTVRYGLVR